MQLIPILFPKCHLMCSCYLKVNRDSAAPLESCVQKCNVITSQQSSLDKWVRPAVITEQHNIIP